jgi:hypothetical protein
MNGGKVGGVLVVLVGVFVGPGGDRVLGREKALTNLTLGALRVGSLV